MSVIYRSCFNCKYKGDCSAFNTVEAVMEEMKLSGQIIDERWYFPILSLSRACNKFELCEVEEK